MAQGQHEKSVSVSKQKPRMPLDSLYLCLAFALESSLDNFRAPSRDVDLIAGTLEIVLCYPCMVMKFSMLVANLLPAMAFMTPNILIFTDTGAAILACYVLLLDINWSFIWLVIFPIMAIIFIWALSQLYRKPYSLGEDHEEAGVIPFSEKRNGKTTSNTVELEFIAIITFGALWAMDELLLDEHATEKFTISQFLLFLSFMLAALTCMMMRLPAGLSAGIAPASELLHKTLLVLLLVTAHTVAGEALGEEVVLFCMPEVIPAVLIWFSIQHGPVSVKMLERYKNYRILLGALVALPSAIMGESACTTIILHCAVSGLLAHYVVFMLSHWPSQQTADIRDPRKHAVELLKSWANDLLIAAAGSLLLRYLLVSGLGWRKALDALCQIFQRLKSALKGQTNTFWSIMALVGAALYNLWCISRAGITKLRKSFGIYNYYLFLVLHMCCFTDDVSRTVYKYNSIALLWKGMQRILVK